MWLLVYSEAVESIQVKVETSRTVILPPTVSVLWSSFHSVYLSVMSFIWLSVMSFILSLWHVFHFVSMLWLSFCLYVMAFILSMCQPSLSVSMSWLSFCPCVNHLFLSLCHGFHFVYVSSVTFCHVSYLSSCLSVAFEWIFFLASKLDQFLRKFFNFENPKKNFRRVTILSRTLFVRLEREYLKCRSPFAQSFCFTA